MQDGILFDNILIASDEKIAESYRKYTWKPKYNAEKAKLEFEPKKCMTMSRKSFQDSRRRYLLLYTQ